MAPVGRRRPTLSASFALSRRAAMPPNAPPLNGERLAYVLVARLPRMWLLRDPISLDPLAVRSKLAFAGGLRVAPGPPVAWRPLTTW